MLHTHVHVAGDAALTLVGPYSQPSFVLRRIFVYAAVKLMLTTSHQQQQSPRHAVARLLVSCLCAVLCVWVAMLRRGTPPEAGRCDGGGGGQDDDATSAGAMVLLLSSGGATCALLLLSSSLLPSEQEKKRQQ